MKLERAAGHGDWQRHAPEASGLILPLVSSLRTQGTVTTWLSRSCLSPAQGVHSDALVATSAVRCPEVVKELGKICK